jgi:6-phosphofructo-2-kinase
MPPSTDGEAFGSSNNAHYPQLRRQSQLSDVAKTAIMSHFHTPSSDESRSPDQLPEPSRDSNLMPPPKSVVGRAIGVDSKHHDSLKAQVGGHGLGQRTTKDGIALTDTPVSTAPNSPQM